MRRIERAIEGWIPWIKQVTTAINRMMEKVGGHGDGLENSSVKVKVVAPASKD